MITLSAHEVWFVTGSQHLYGDETLAQVAAHAQEIAKAYQDDAAIVVQVRWKPTVTTSDEIIQVVRAANTHPSCIGLILWMHTFSPAKMWISGLNELNKPFLHLHTQFNSAIPWDTIDMDFMNLNQSAHGGREFGFIAARMRLRRKVVVGHWKDPKTIRQIDHWCRVASAVADSKQMKIARLGDNMRQVAVTEGNKVSAQLQFGYEVNGYGLGDLTAFVDAVSDKEIANLLEEYRHTYVLDKTVSPGGALHQSLRDAAQIELGLRAFLEDGNFTAFTDTFENLHGLKQLPGIAVQRLMARGYGFGAEGDWKTAALVRSLKVMAAGLDGGNSFMEDYTYHFGGEGNLVLGAHMLELCPSIAQGPIRAEVHPLGIGGKEDPARLVFQAGSGNAVNVSIIDLGHRFRMLANTVNTVPMTQDMPKLPVARVLWSPHPSLEVAAAAWILAGGAHHTCYSQNVTVAQLEDFAEIFDIEFLLIDERTDLYRFKQELRWNAMAFQEKP